MQRIFNIDKWTEVPKGQAVRFPGDMARKVSLDVNCPRESVLFLIAVDRFGVKSKPVFLALVKGRDTVEFYVGGPFEIMTPDEQVFVYTADSDGITFENVEAETFTVVTERRERNPELDYIAHKMSQNLQRRMDAQANELAAIFGARQTAVEAQLTAQIDALRARQASVAAADDGTPTPAGGTLPPDGSEPPPSGPGNGGGAASGPGRKPKAGSAKPG